MIVIYKTNVSDESELNVLRPYFSKIFPEIRWSFDLEDCDKILRVDGVFFEKEDVVRLLRYHGFFCEEFPY